MHIKLVMAMSLDGKIARYPGETNQSRKAFGFLSKEDREHVEAILKSADSIICGAETIRAASAESSLHKYPLQWAVLSKRGLDADTYKNVNSGTIFIGPEVIENLPERFFFHQAKNSNPAKELVENLSSKGFKNAVLFGGGQVAALFFAANLVTEVNLTICPVIFGSKNSVGLIEQILPEPSSLELESSNSKGNLVFLNYKVKATHSI